MLQFVAVTHGGGRRGPTVESENNVNKFVVTMFVPPKIQIAFSFEVGPDSY